MLPTIAQEPQTIIVRRGEPFEATIVIDGDQTLSTILFQAAPRGSDPTDDPTLEVELDVIAVTGVGVAAQTEARIVIAALDVDALTPGVVYTYRVTCDGGSSVARGALHAGQEWS